MMKITVIGGGYVGLVSGACLAESGHDVTIVEVSPEKVAALRAGKIPIYEPGLDQVIARNKKHLTYTTEMSEGVPGAEVVLLAVGTPSLPNGTADLSYIFAAAEQVALAATAPLVLVTKSTVPVGTNRRILEAVRSTRPDLDIEIVSNPEFLREGNAIQDFMQPDRIVIGADSQHAFKKMRSMYACSLNRHVKLIEVSVETAEMAKYAANAFLATKVAFINEMADLCEKTGADIQQVAVAMGLDHRIGTTFLRAGPGFGGSCFPKDTLALIETGRAYDSPMTIVQTVVISNNARKARMSNRLIDIMGGSLAGKVIAVFGLTFKANTDDMRDSPALDIVPQFTIAGATVRVHDPEGMTNAKTAFSSAFYAANPAVAPITYHDSPLHTAKDADAVVVLTEWSEYASLDPAALRGVMRGDVVLDLRGIWNPMAMQAAGFNFHSVGRR